MADSDAEEMAVTVAGDRPVQLADQAELDGFCADVDIALLEFYTEGCGICQSMEPVLGNVARALDVAVGVVNPRDDPPLVERFDVRSVPLFVLVVDSEPVTRRADGFVAAEDLTAWIREETEHDIEGRQNDDL